MNGKILVTGAAGFVGSHTVEKLLEEGYQVVGIDNLNDYYDTRLKTYRLKRLTKMSHFDFHQIDIENYLELESIFKSNTFSAVINFAARAGVRHSLINPHIYLSTNTLGTLNILECMRKYGVSKFVLPSTSSLYAGQEMPFVETLSLNQPISPYAASKKSAEMFAYSYHHLYGIDVSILRYFTVYGPYGRPDMSIFRFIRQIDEGEAITIYGDGTQSRDFTFVSDIVQGTILSLKPLGHEVINLGGGFSPISLNDAIKLIEQNLQTKHKRIQKEMHMADMISTHADITKAKHILGWSPKVDLEMGIRLAVDWYRSEKDFCRALNLNIAGA